MLYPELIIFDLDGTLVDSRADIANAVNFTLQKVGLKEKGCLEIVSYIGRGVEDLIRKALGKNQEGFFSDALSIFEDYYQNHSSDESILYPNVKEVLEHFRNSRKIIVTNRKHRFALLTLTILGINEYFEDIVGGDNIACAKPSSCPLDSAIKKFNVDRENVIMIGDMDLDILAGKDAGVVTCAVTYGIGERNDINKARPDFIIDDILELKHIIHLSRKK